MRVIGYLPHPFMKITVFSLNMKFAVKFEMGLMEQTYKIRASDEVNGLESIAVLIDENFTAACLDRFQEMAADLSSCFSRYASGRD